MRNKEELGKDFEDKEIILMICDELKISPSQLAKEIGDDKGNSIYQITGGHNNISRKMAGKILARFPQINSLFIDRGKLPVKNSPMAEKIHENIFSDEAGDETHLSVLKDIRGYLRIIAEKLP